MEAARPYDEPVVAVHRDLHDGQLLAGEGLVALLDLDGLAAGAPMLDAANLSAHFELRVLQGLGGADAHGAEVCGRALFEGFAVADTEGLHAALRFYQATTFLRLALLYALRPRWAHLARPLVHYAERCLDELALA